MQLIGTVMFNFNTGNAFISVLNWVQQDILICTPNIIRLYFFDYSSPSCIWPFLSPSIKFHRRQVC